MNRVSIAVRSAAALACLVTCALVPLSAAAGTTNIVLRLDAREFVSAVTGLATWSDSSGNGHDAAQGTAGYRPDVVTDVQNGLPVVRFGGSDDFMTVASTYTAGTAFAVAKYTSTTFNWYDGLYGCATNNGALGMYWTGLDGGTAWDNSAGSAFQNAKYLNGTLTGTALTNPSKFNLYSGVDSTPNSFDSWSVGRDRGIGGRTWEGDIAEIIVYDDAMSDFDRKGVEVHLDEKWGLGLGLRASYGAGNFNDDTAALGLTVDTTPVLRMDAAQYSVAVTGLDTWGDSSIHGHDATAYGTPDVVMNVQNGLPVVRFDGAADYMRVLHTYITGSAFIVAEYDGIVFSGHDGLYGAATGYGSAEQYWSGGDGGTSWGNESGSGFQNSKYLNGTLTGTALTNPSKFNLYSGVDSTPASFTSWAFGTDRKWTSGRLWDGDIGEIVVYEDALTDFDRRGVEVYLDEKWGLGLGLRSSYGTGSFNEDLEALGLTIGITMALHLDASKFSTAGNISTWNDSSGNDRNAAAASDPSVTLNAQNGLAVVSFDGNDYFTIPDTYTTGTAFAVAKYNSTTFNGYDGLYTGDGSAGSEIYWSGENGSADLWYETSLDDRYFNSALGNTGLSNPSAFNLYSGVDYTPQSLTGYNIGADRSSTFGGGRAWEGDIAEVIVYEEALSTFDRKGVEVYLDEKWGLGLGLRSSYGEGNFNDSSRSLGLPMSMSVFRFR